ncbi:hypothetical protein P7K49_019722 [Saguinus oedipus]|uniref:Uncharacterized protein n=1 Tax=Saguinus oedipus TaxID=9490 RepID=A0ABQ9UYW4_SAGOE|nr:hypothetical protein P7K49_019722 [Saguinus oedipus]
MELSPRSPPEMLEESDCPSPLELKSAPSKKMWIKLRSLTTTFGRYKRGEGRTQVSHTPVPGEETFPLLLRKKEDWVKDKPGTMFVSQSDAAIGKSPQSVDS